MTPRVRRFLLLLLGFAAYVACVVLTPLKVFAGIMFFLSLALFVWFCWHIAKDPFPWRLPWRRP